MWHNDSECYCEWQSISTEESLRAENTLASGDSLYPTEREGERVNIADGIAAVPVANGDLRG